MDRDWQGLADHIKAGMARFGWSQRDLAEHAGVGVRTVGDLLSGRPRRWIPNTMPAIEAALRWPPGTARRILDGERVELDYETKEQPDGDDGPPFEDPVEQEIWEMQTLSEREKWEHIEYRRARIRAAKRAG